MKNLSRKVFREVTAQGLRFDRRADGAVIVWRSATADERLASYDGPQYRRLAIIPANEWASVISSLSTEGETGFTFGLALEFHTGGTEYDPEAPQYETEGA